jgi:REP element-mobilizing transposase RayT
MANSYTQLLIHGVFAVKYRNAVIEKAWQDELFGYIYNINDRIGNKSLIVGGYRDHVHILFGMKATMSLADTMRLIKTNSSKWLNTSGKLTERFEWQDGYSGFAISKSHQDAVYRYIATQEQHHAKVPFMQEQVTLLVKNGIDFEDARLFQPLI